MNINEEAEIKKEFQLERVILFSDAVFAIIITIMVLDIRLPEGLRHADAITIKRAFVQLIPKILAYGLSFFLVSKFWREHLKMFSILKDYDSKLLAYNLLYLFSISLYPFAVSLVSGNTDLESMQFTWAGYTYVGIFLFSTFSQTLMATYLVNNQHKLCYNVSNLDSILTYKARRLNYFIIPIMISIMVAISYLALQPVFAIYTLALYGIAMSRISKKYYPKKTNNGPILARLFRFRRRKAVMQERLEVRD